MLELDRITTLYSPEQDRISLSANLREGGTARIWLTQRIVDRLISALVKIVKPHHPDPVYAEIIAGVAQQQAVSRHELQAPVKITETEHEWLVSKIDLQMPRSGVVVIFYNAAGQNARVAMNVELLRQWLTILRRVYVTAEWDGAEWPEWLAITATTNVSSKVVH